MNDPVRPVRELQRWRTVAREEYTRHVQDHVQDTSASRVPFSELQSILDDYVDSEIFVHVGLRDVNAAFGRRSYDRLYSELASQFENVLVPGFTPSFRESGVYHKQFSRPEVGMFPVLFMDDADYRTNDALHSVQVAGDYRFDDCNHHDSFGPDGCYAKLDADNVLIANIGTDRLVSTQYHYISMQADTPYHETETHSGAIYYDETDHRRIAQQNDTFTGIYKWSRWKMEDYLEDRGVLERRDRNGLKLSFFRAGDMRDALEPKIERDPYYMVT